VDERATRMRERAAEFERMSATTLDPVIHAELRRLSLLYLAQADRLERGEPAPSDPGEG
jgi:hypothetical protein